MARIVDTGGRGNCLFTCLGKELRISQHELRDVLADYVKENLESQFMQETLHEWIHNSGQRSIQDYLNYVRTSGNQGSALEIAIISKIYQRRIVVWIALNDEIEKGIRDIAEYQGNKPTIHLFYRNEHYQLLKFD